MEKETTEEKRNEMKETGSMKLDSNNRKHNVRLLTIIGEIEGHEAVSGNTKATKYEHLLPMLAEVEDSEEIDGLLILLNTMGGDVEAGLSIAEMIASISKPTVSLVLGGSHSIGGPLAVAADYSIYRPERNYDHTSGQIKWHVYWSTAKSPKYDPDSKTHYRVSCSSFPYERRTYRRTDA